MNLKRLLVTASAALIVGAVAAPAPAQPKHPKAKAAKEKAKEKAKERREDRKEKKGSS